MFVPVLSSRSSVVRSFAFGWGQGSAGTCHKKPALGPQEKAEAMYQRISEFLQILGYQWGSPIYGVVT